MSGLGPFQASLSSHRKQLHVQRQYVRKLPKPMLQLSDSDQKAQKEMMAELSRIRPYTTDLTDKITNYMEQLVKTRQHRIRTAQPSLSAVLKGYPRVTDLRWALVSNANRQIRPSWHLQTREISGDR